MLRRVLVLQVVLQSWICHLASSKQVAGLLQTGHPSSQLGKMMAKHRALTVQCQTEAAALCSDVKSAPSQKGADLTRSRNNVMQAMYSQFSWRQLQLSEVPGFGPYTDVTLTFDFHL